MGRIIRSYYYWAHLLSTSTSIHHPIYLVVMQLGSPYKHLDVHDQSNAFTLFIQFYSNCYINHAKLHIPTTFI